MSDNDFNSLFINSSEVYPLASSLFCVNSNVPFDYDTDFIYPNGVPF